ncbi:MAG: hypothetical protein A2147_08160 [Chloroflexi bacterium RBG_16_57_8]|nr:MAG: hypothetical protein A2147_08160 [Chloroflexi bacterium RBG_16_57_8]
MATELAAATCAHGGSTAQPGARRPIVAGIAAAVLLLVVYGGIIALVQGWDHALDQTAKLWYWVVILAAGFGAQAGLFVFIRQELKARQKATTASVATSGGVSAGSMAACCAHHLTDVLAAIGISGLAAFLVSYQVAFIVIGVLSNMVGISIMLETIQRHGLWPRVARFRWDMGRVKKWVLASSGVIIIAVFLGTFLAQRT